MSRHRRCQRDRARHLLKRTERNATQPVFLVDDFALFGDAQPAINGSWRGTQYGNMRLAAATTDRATASVE